eukprot:1298257-Amphidinium_carterae.1
MALEQFSYSFQIDASLPKVTADQVYMAFLRPSGMTKISRVGTRGTYEPFASASTPFVKEKEHTNLVASGLLGNTRHHAPSWHAIASRMICG